MRTASASEAPAARATAWRFSRHWRAAGRPPPPARTPASGGGRHFPRAKTRSAPGRALGVWGRARLVGRPALDEPAAGGVEADLARAEQQAAGAYGVRVRSDGPGGLGRHDGVTVMSHPGRRYAMANALAHETSPYLRQHAENP